MFSLIFYSLLLFFSEISLIFAPTEAEFTLFKGKVMKINTVLASYAAGMY